MSLGTAAQLRRLMINDNPACGPSSAPGRPQAHAVVHDQRAGGDKERRDHDLGALDAEGGPPFALLGHLPAMKPASFISRDVALLFLRHPVGVLLAGHERSC